MPNQDFDQIARNWSPPPTDKEGQLPRARRDVEITEQVYYGKPCFVLKDPATLRYYRLRPPEYSIYQMLDGKITMEDILRELAQRFPNDKYDVQTIMSFIVMLRGANLLHIPGESDTEYLLKRKKKLTRSLFQKIRQEFLFYRIPVFDPDRLLIWLHNKIGGFLFGRLALFLVLALLAGAVALLLENIEKLGQAQPILSWWNMLYLMPSLLVIKCIHEFGHGLTSKHYGSEVHEMGILFLIFTPCFYCDVSDSWMISQKTRRMAITAAGVLVEIVLAGVATYVWALTEPKTVLNQFALNFMLAASVNTLLFNGNPLLRYDGYYFLMDLLEIPNLKQKGTAFLWYLFQRYVLGMEHAQEPLDVKGREATVLSYAILSAIYRWFIMFAIIALVWSFLDPYGWGVIGALMAVGSIYTSFIKPIFSFFAFLNRQRHQIHLKIATAVILAVLILGSLYLLLALPVEQSIETQCLVRPRSVQMLYVTQPGFIDPGRNTALVQDGQVVQAGQVLLQLSDPQLEFEAADLELQIGQYQAQRHYFTQMGDLAKTAEAAAKLKGLQAQLERARQNLEKLTIRSPFDGRVQLHTREPLHNMLGSYVPIQTALMAVYAYDDFEVVAAVNHRKNGLIEPGQKVEILLWPYDGQTLESVVETKPPKPVWRMSSPAFSTVFGGDVATMPAAKTEEALEPADNTYELVLSLKHDALPKEIIELRDGMIGRAKIILEEKTLAKAVYFWFLQTLRQDLRL